MIDGRLLAEAFQRNRWIIRRQAEGLGHDQSLIATSFNINTLNWVIGHVVDYRSGLVELLGGERMLPSAETERYRKESDPVTEDGPGVHRLGRLLEMLDAAQDRLDELLGALGPSDWERRIEIGGRTLTVGERVHFLYFHDTYHTGQTELLRQVTGANDKVI